MKRRPSAWLILLGVVLLWTGCDNMKHQAHSTPLDSTDQFHDGTSARTPPSHTVPNGPLMAWSMETGETGGRPVAQSPVAVTAALLTRGQERYSIYCAVCHGDDGYGSGIVVRRGYPGPPSFHDARLRAAPAGQLYQAIARGSGKMYPLADRIDVKDRWAIVAYVRALQLSQHAALADVPDSERAALLRP
jgi:mono/diheme cytochrome c family protein